MREKQVYYVIFDKRRGRWRFWNIAAYGNFAHCYIITPVSTGGCILLAPIAGYFKTEFWKLPAEEAIAYIRDAHMTILRITLTPDPARFRFRGLINCTTIVKYILGIKGLCFTPKGLYGLLKKQGAVELV